MELFFLCPDDNTTMRPELVDGVPVAFCERESLDEQREEVCEWAENYLAWRSQCTARPAAVFDIDATLLYGQDSIHSVIRLYNTAKDLGITRFIVTARSDDGKSYTLNELDKHGIEHPRHLFMHPKDKPCTSSSQAGEAKERSRRRIQKKEFDILINVGDAFHDHFTPPMHRNLQKTIGNSRCAVFVDPEDGCAHLKLVHP